MRQHRGIEGLTSPMVGREAELGRLNDAMAELCRGNGRIVSIIGEAGLGKSRLCMEFNEQATADDHVIWADGQCHSYEDSTPYAPFKALVEGRFGIQPDDSDDLRLIRINDGVDKLLGPEDHSHAVYLATLLGLEPLEEDAHLLAYLEPPVLMERIFAAVVAMVEARAQISPVVFAFEDVHWADPTSVELIQRLLPLTERVPLMMLLMFRPRRDEPSWQIHELAQREHQHRYDAIELQPLDATQAQDLVANLLKVEGLKESVRQLILRKAEGNPFFVEEVIRSLLDSGVVVREGEFFVATEDLDDLEVPDTLAAVLATRLDKLDPGVRRVAQTAAVIGREFDYDLLEPITDPGVDLEAALRTLQQRELIQESRRGSDRVFAFKHALTRDTAYNTLLVSVRQDLHRLVGKLLEERSPDRVHDLARHFELAGEPRRAVPYLNRAAEASAKAFANTDAIRSFAKVIELWSDQDDPAMIRTAYEGLGAAQMLTGQMQEALDTFDAMQDFARELDDQPMLISGLNKKAGVLLFGLGEVEEADEHFKRAKVLAEEHDDQQGIAEFHVGYCFLNMGDGRLEEAANHLGEAAEVCFTLDSFHRNFGLAHYASTQVLMLKHEEAERALALAIETASRDGDRVHEAHAISWAGLEQAMLGEPVAGYEKSVIGARATEEVGAVLTYAFQAWIAGWLAQRVGRYEESIHHLTSAVEVAGQIGAAGFVGACQGSLAVAHHAVQGEGHEPTRELVRAAVEVLMTPAGRSHASTVLADLAHMMTRDPSMGSADVILEHVDGWPSATQHMAEPDILLCQGTQALMAENVDEAERLFNKASEFIEANRLRLWAPRAALAHASIAAARGNVKELAEYVRRACDGAQEMELLPDANLVRRAGAKLLVGAGRDDLARVYLGRAGEAVAEMAGLFTDPDLRRSFLRSQAQLV